MSIYVHKTGDHDNKKDFLKAVWSRKGIYLQVLVHLYDTATDIGVLIEWYRLAYDDIDYESINMKIMFWTSVTFLYIYRLVLMKFGIEITKSMMAHYLDDVPSRRYYLHACLGLWDMYIIKTVYDTLKNGYQEATAQQKVIQLLESIFESLPQVLFL